MASRAVPREATKRQSMNQQAAIDRAQTFRALHDRKHALLLPNAWDAGSAALFASAGFPAIATTSGGVAWSLGYADGEHVPYAETLAALRRMVRVLAVPLTVDFEAGYGDTPALVAAHVRDAIDIGASGLNLEDGIRHQSLRPLDDAAARIAAARKAADAAGVPIFLNARVDAFMIEWPGSAAARMDEAVRRAQAYLAAGADGVYPIGLHEPEAMRTFCARVDAPVNVMAGAGLPDLAALAALGVARVTTGTHLATLAYASAHDAACGLRASGRFDGMAASLGYGQLQQLFPHA
jgi:2-methylisocitrate lyase-like PEP mutase family enzyme